MARSRSLWALASSMSCSVNTECSAKMDSMAMGSVTASQNREARSGPPGAGVFPSSRREENACFRHTEWISCWQSARCWSFSLFIELVISQARTFSSIESPPSTSIISFSTSSTMRRWSVCPRPRPRIR